MYSYIGEPSESYLRVLADVDTLGEDYFIEDDTGPNLWAAPWPPARVIYPIPEPPIFVAYRRDTLPPEGKPPRPQILPKLRRAYNARDARAVDSLLTSDFRFILAQENDTGGDSEDYWGKPEFMMFIETLFDPEFTSERGFYGAENIYAEFVLISKRPIDVPDSNHWELICDVKWLISNSRQRPKPFAATYKSVACLTLKPDSLNEGSWLISDWREESAEVRLLYR